jgi:hypothetical protein
MSVATKSKAATGSRGGYWTGPTRPYDLIKEATVALVVVSLLTALLAALFSSPDEKSLSLQSWAKDAPDNLYSTVVAELAGTSPSASYGPPYNSASEGQQLGPLKLAKWAGVTKPIDSAQAFVVGPLSTQSDAATKTALAAWQGASADQQAKWAGDYATAIDDAGGAIDKVAAGDYGPVPAMAKAEVDMAASGALDTSLVSGGPFYLTDYTKALLFLGDGSYLEDTAGTQHLQGSQWGMMNSTGNYPGQAWLWLATFWYQIPPFNDETNSWGGNADAIIFGGLMLLLSLLLLLVPFVPGLRSIPKWIPLHRLIWRDWYRSHGAGG